MPLSLLALGVLRTAPAASWEHWRHRASCERKVPYFTQADAQAALDRWHGHDPTVQVYGCTACGFFHHGHTPL